MRIYIVEDDTSVIGILEDIVEGNELGVVCGDSGGEPANLGQILALDPDLVLVDLLMPQKDGIQVVRELKEQGCRAKFIMISQVSNKEMVAKAYLAGVDFFINKPINLIEVRQVILMCAASWKMSGTSTPFRASLQKRPLRWDGAAAWKPSASGSRPP